MHGCGVRVVFLEHGTVGCGILQVLSLHLIMDLCSLLSHCFALNYFLVSERGRRKPLAERSALYTLLDSPWGILSGVPEYQTGLFWSYSGRYLGTSGVYVENAVKSFGAVGR